MYKDCQPFTSGITLSHKVDHIFSNAVIVQNEIILSGIFGYCINLRFNLSLIREVTLTGRNHFSPITQNYFTSPAMYAENGCTNNFFSGNNQVSIY